MQRPCVHISIALAPKKSWRVPSHRKAPRNTDFALYCERNFVERFFYKFNNYRGTATRFDKLSSTFLAGVLLVSMRIWLN